MRKALRNEAEHLVAQVEERTGLPVQIVPLDGLGVAAQITLSPHATDSYVLRYRPGLSYKDYAIAFQCAFLLRTLAIPEGDRRQFALHESALQWGTTVLKSHLRSTRKPALPDPVAGTFVSQLVGGLLTQLRSIPIGMRVDEWLIHQHPSLADLQAQAFEAQQGEARASLGPQIKAMVPEEILAASVMLNTAYALFCDRMLGQTAYQVPYVSAGFGDFGAALLRLYDETPSDAASDIALVDRWAAEIGLSGKYQWVPFPASVQQVS